MKRNLTLFALWGLVIILPILGCGKKSPDQIPKNLKNKSEVSKTTENKDNADATTEDSTETSLIDIIIYSFDEETGELIENNATMEEINDDNLLSELKKINVISDDIKLNGKSQKSQNQLGQNILTLNFSEALTTYINKQTNPQICLYAITNTFNKAYNVDIVCCTINGNSIITANGNYDAVEFFDGKIEAPTINYNDIAMEFDKIEELNKNAQDTLYSPILIDSNLFILSKCANATAANQMTSLINTVAIDKSYESSNIQISNAIFYNNTPNKEKTLEPTLIDKFNNYRMVFTPLNYEKDKTSIKEINSFISGKTDKTIKDAINNITQDDNIYLASVANFTGTWKTGFDESANLTNMTVANIAGESQIINMMYSVETAKYLTNENATGFIKELNNNCEFVAILPNANIKKLSDVNLDTLLASAQDKNVAITMPKLNVGYVNDLSSIVATKYNNITSDTNEYNLMFSNYSNKVAVQSILNAAKINLGNTGESAAVTIGTITDEMVTLDRPFYYLIIDKTTNEIIFVGHHTYM